MDSALTVTNREPAARTILPRFGWVLVGAALLVYGVILARHVGAYAGGSDSSGYMNHARLLGEGREHLAPRTVPRLSIGHDTPWLYSALGFKPAPDGDGLVATYPTGLPLLILAAARLVGWRHAGDVAMWLHGMAGALLTYALGRAFKLSRPLAVLGALIVAGSPVYLFMAVQTMSDVPALVWTTAAVLAAWHSRSQPRWALAAGFAFALAVLIRPTDLLAVVPVAIALGGSGRRWLAYGLAGLPGAVFFCLDSHAAYGSWFTTGYGDISDLGWQWVGPTLLHYARWLPVLFTPVVVAFLGLPALVRRTPRAVAVLGSWVLVFGGFYAAYAFTHQTWWYTRFLLPMAPALVIGALLVIQAALAARLSPRPAAVLCALALIGTLALDRREGRSLGALDSGRGERHYFLTASWLQQHVPPDAVIAAMQVSGALQYYTHFTYVRWDLATPAQFRRVTAAVAAAHRPLYAVLFPFEIQEWHAFTEHMTDGVWTKVGHVRDITIWKWSPGP